ncbi:MAG: cyclic-di-AMP receptor [Chloroflexi bacterium]|nr:cyclic-di-AMP receptor [Chloroflexota bacterium]
MKLIMSIVNHEDSRGLLEGLMQRGFQATVISTTGGFLREGNATILVGTEDDKVEEVLRIIRERCRTRTRYISPLPLLMEPGELPVTSPVEVQVGGGTSLVLNVERWEKC